MLSVGGADLSQIVASPNLTATPQVYRATPTGLSPSQVRQAYGLNQVSFGNGAVAGDGTGQTIAIVTAYDNPNIGSDLRQFDRQFGLPNPPSFIKYVQAGRRQIDPGWALETALDVEWAHAMAPKANIALVEARSASLSDLFGAVNFARSLSGVVAVEMSWGTSEFYGENDYDGLFTTPAGHVGGSGLPGGVTFVAASGDTGAWYGLSYPAVSPNVLAVGGTSLGLGANSSYGYEQGWSGSTGGFSPLEPAPSYQVSTQAASGLSYGLRTVPDVSMVGDPATGLSVYSTVPTGGRSGWFTVGGTSAAAPLWAGLIAVADQGLALAGRGSLGAAQAALYAIPSSAFHQVSSGFNGYFAGAGYDLVTGLGSPIANRVVAGLLATQSVYNVTGFPAGSLTSVQLATARFTLTVNTTDGSGATTAAGGSTVAGGSTFAGSTNLFPVFPPNIVIVVTTVGNARVVIVIPTVTVSATAFASNNHPVQHQVSAPVILASQSQDTFNKFGQTLLDDHPVYRRLGSLRDVDLVELIDFVEPFQPGGPVKPLDNAAAAAGAEATVMLPERHLPFGPADLHLRATADQTLEERAEVLDHVLPFQGASGEAAAQPAWLSSTLAGAAALVGGGYWMTFRDLARGLDASRPVSRRFKPRIRGFSLPRW